MINCNNGFIIDPDITTILKVRYQRIDMVSVVLCRILLFEQNMLILSVPGSCPVLICPTQHKRKIRFATLKYLIERSFKNSFSVEPVMVITKAINTMFFRKLSMHFSYFGNPKIIKP